ncbi:MAG: hypothetical protein IJB15_09810, partial [Clostridia bacterium]|nr:hypothetical protein [Clostridia bacterium]
DHWMNAGDPDAGMWSAFDFTLDTKLVPADAWREILIRFDTEVGTARVYDGDKLLTTVHKKLDTPDGISYIHLQTDAEQEDFDGTYIRKLACTGE